MLPMLLLIVGFFLLIKGVDMLVDGAAAIAIFNILFILGISALIRPLPFIAKANMDISMVVLASLLFVFS